MTAERWMRLRELLDSALDQPEARAALLERVCNEDPALGEDLKRLILDAEEDAADDVALEVPALLGQRVGAYRIVRELGRGGMGTVFLAMRDDGEDPLPAALKFLRHDFLDPEMSRNLRHEWRVLVRLDHPNITRLLDWGTASGGLHYLAMEYVDGQPITRYCSENGLSLKARLELFLDVCAAIQHAHQNLIVHRDLKPSNILVAAPGKVKVVDFGIAARLGAATALATAIRGRWSPGYASPEQILGEAVTTATDVYSLGVLLYELLTGGLPYGKHAAGRFAAMETPPALASQTASLAGIGARDLRGDLDCIVSKALRIEPAKRFRSVEQLSSDIRCYLEGAPVVARQGSRWYAIGRHVRRHRGNLAMVGVAAAALITGTAVSVSKWRAAEKNLWVAEGRYQSLRSFARSVVADVDTNAAVSVTEMQHSMAIIAVKYLDQLSRERPEDGDLQSEIAAAYVHVGRSQGGINNANLGEPASALLYFRKAHAIYLAQWTSRADYRSALGLLRASTAIENVVADPAEAIDSTRKDEALVRSVSQKWEKDANLLDAAALFLLIRGQRQRTTGDLRGALATIQTAIALSADTCRLSGDAPASLDIWATSTSEFAYVRSLQGDNAGALPLSREAVRAGAKAAAAQPSNKYKRQLAFKYTALAELLIRTKSYFEAMQQARRALGELQAIASGDSGNEQAKLDLSLAYVRMGDIELGQGRYENALRDHFQALRLRQAQYLQHPSNSQAAGKYVATLNRVAQALLALHRDPSAADGEFSQAVATGRQLIVREPSNVYYLTEVARAFRGRAEIAERRRNQAAVIEYLRQSADIWREVERRCPLDVELRAEAQECNAALVLLQRRQSKGRFNASSKSGYRNR